MHCVAICELARPLEQEEEPIAAALGLAAYDVRIRLGGVLPRVVARHEDAAGALALAEALRQRGHGTIVFDVEDAPTLATMTLLRRFDVEGNQLFANDRRPPSRPLDEIVAIVHAAMAARVARTTPEQTFRATGRGVVREEVMRTTTEQTLEQVVLLYWREGKPWLLRPSEARYLALGAQMRSTIHDNFQAAVEWFRARAANAVYDDRFMRQPLAALRTINTRDNQTASPLSSDRGIELTLHALGTWLGRGRQGPYR